MVVRLYGLKDSLRIHQMCQRSLTTMSLSPTLRAKRQIPALGFQGICTLGPPTPKLPTTNPFDPRPPQHQNVTAWICWTHYEILHICTFSFAFWIEFFCSLRKGKSISFSSEGTAFSVTEWLIEKRESHSIGVWMISDEDLDSRNCSLDRKNLCSTVKVFVSLESQNYESLVLFNT